MTQYDDMGNVVTAIDSNGRSTVYEFDALSRLSAVAEPDPDGAGPLSQAITNYSYDPAGNLRASTDANGHQMTFEYDGRDRRTKTVDPDGGITVYTYDSDNNLASLTDPVGNTTSFTYDARSRLSREVDPLGKFNQHMNMTRPTTLLGRSIVTTGFRCMRTTM